MSTNLACEHAYRRNTETVLIATPTCMYACMHACTLREREASMHAQKQARTRRSAAPIWPRSWAHAMRDVSRECDEVYQLLQSDATTVFLGNVESSLAHACVLSVSNNCFRAGMAVAVQLVLSDNNCFISACAWMNTKDRLLQQLAQIRQDVWCPTYVA